MAKVTRGATLSMAFKILEAFYASPGPVTIQQIAASMDICYGSATNYLAVLEESGFIEFAYRQQGRGRTHFFQLGPRLVELGAKVARRKRADREIRA